MPLYEFECEECHHLFELLITGTPGAEEHCPKCGAKRLTRQMSAFAVVSPDSTSTECGGYRGCANCESGECPYTDEDI